MDSPAPPPIARCSVCGETQAEPGVCRACGVGECATPKPKGAHRNAVHVSQVASHDDAERHDTGMPGLNRVLGGGLVDDSAVLIYGGEGSGKTTLLAQLGRNLARRGLRVYSWSGEENAEQVKARAVRVGLDSQGSEEEVPLWLRHTSSLEDVQTDVREIRPDVILGDSAQTLATLRTSGHAGSVEQIREIGRWLVDYSKRTACALVLVSQLNADGDPSGGRYLRHLVDVVLELGEDGAGGRWLTAPKNRYGQTGETVWLEMTPTGLEEAPDAAREVLERTGHGAGVVFLPDASAERATWVRVEAVISDEEGEPLLRGIDGGRVRPVLRILREQAGLDLSGRSISLEVGTVLGAPCKDPGLELALAAAILSADGRRPWPRRTAAWGRLSIRGAVEPVARDHARAMACSEVGAWLLCPEAARGVSGGTRVAHVGQLVGLLAGAGVSGPGR